MWSKSVFAEQSPDAFPQTRWSLVLDAQKEDPEALATICKSYWYPIYAYARRLRDSSADAEDLTQAFFEFLLSKDLLKNAERDRGRLRGWLQATLKHFATSQWRKENAQKRGGGKVIEMDAQSAEQRLAMEPHEHTTPETEFDRCWAREILQQSKTKLQTAYEKAGKGNVYVALEGLLDPSAEEVSSYAELADQLGLTQSGTRFNAFKLRRRFKDMIEEVIRDTVATAEDAAAELAYLQSVFENPNA